MDPINAKQTNSLWTLLIPKKYKLIKSKQPEACTEKSLRAPIIFANKNKLSNFANEKEPAIEIRIVETMQKQIFYSHCCKFIMLFALALVHIFYMHPFLELYSTLETYSNRMERQIRIEQHHPQHYVLMWRNQMLDLASYKNNLWMVIAALFLNLPTSSFIVFLPTLSDTRKALVYLVGTIDFLAFTTLSVFLWSRKLIVEQVENQLETALEAAHRVLPMENLMNEAQCTVFARENLPLCFTIIAQSTFPTQLIKYLVILCILVIAYGITSYVIYWCLKHWIPESTKTLRLRTSPSGKLLKNCNSCHSSASAGLPSSLKPTLIDSTLLTKCDSHNFRVLP